MTSPEPFPATVPAPGIPAVMASRLRPGRATEVAALRRLVALTDRRDGFHVAVIPDGVLPPVTAAHRV